MSKVTKRQLNMQEELAGLKRDRKLAIAKCALALVIIVIVVLTRNYLVDIGVFKGSDIAVGAVCMAIALVLAVFGGSASTKFYESGKRMRELERKLGKK